MLILKLATRNLFRQLGRNALSMVSIIMGVLVIIAGRGMANGLDENVYRPKSTTLDTWWWCPPTTPSSASTTPLTPSTP